MTAETTTADVHVKIETPEKTFEEDLKISSDDKKADEGNKGKYPRKLDKEYYEERRRVWEEAQKDKELVEQNVKGAVKWYSVIGRYGFIERADGKGDVFVHQSVIAKSKVEKYFLRTLDNGEEVVFDIVQGKKGLEASNVTGPDGADVKGSKYYRVLLNKYRRAFRRPRFDGNKKGDRKSSKKDSNEKDEGDKDQENDPDAEVKDGKKPNRPYRRRRFQRKSTNADSASTGKEQEAGGQRRRRHGSSNANKSASNTTDVGSNETKLAGNAGDATPLAASLTVEALVA